MKAEIEFFLDLVATWSLSVWAIYKCVCVCVCVYVCVCVCMCVCVCVCVWFKQKQRVTEIKDIKMGIRKEGSEHIAKASWLGSRKILSLCEFLYKQHCMSYIKCYINRKRERCYLLHKGRKGVSGGRKSEHWTGSQETWLLVLSLLMAMLSFCDLAKSLPPYGPQIPLLV
jgi:hypothetical protein